MRRSCFLPIFQHRKFNKMCVDFIAIDGSAMHSLVTDLHKKVIGSPDRTMNFSKEFANELIINTDGNKFTP